MSAMFDIILKMEPNYNTTFFAVLRNYFEEKNFVIVDNFLKRISFDWKQIDLEKDALSEYIIKKCRITELVKISLVIKFGSHDMMNDIIKRRRSHLINVIKKNDHITDFIFDNYLEQLNDHEIIAFFDKDSSYISRYFRTRSQSKFMLACCKDDIKYIDENIKNIDERTIKLCMEYLKSKNNFTLLALFPEDQEEYVLRAIKDRDLNRVIKFLPKDRNLSDYIYQAYEAKFLRMIRIICKKSDSYLVYKDVLLQNNIKLFTYMLRCPGLCHQSLLKVLEDDNEIEAIKLILEFPSFETFKDTWVTIKYL